MVDSLASRRTSGRLSRNTGFFYFGLFASLLGMISIIAPWPSLR